MNARFLSQNSQEFQPEGESREFHYRSAISMLLSNVHFPRW